MCNEAADRTTLILAAITGATIVAVVALICGVIYLNARVFADGGYELQTLPGHNWPVWVKPDSAASSP